MKLLPLNQKQSGFHGLVILHGPALRIHVVNVGFLLFLQELSFRLYSFKAEKDERGSHNINPCTDTPILLF